MRVSLATFLRSVGVALLAGFCTSAVQAGFDFDEKGNAFVAGQAVVMFKAKTTLITAKSILARYGADPSSIQFFNERSAVVQFDERKDVLSFCRQLSGSGWTPAVAPNYIHSFLGVPNDTYYSLQWGLKGGSPGVTPTMGADFIGAWSQMPNLTIGSGVRVAVVDSGIDMTPQPELAMIPNGPVIANTGATKPIWDAVPGLMQAPAIPAGASSRPPYVYGPGAPNDDVGHGTHVAGIIAARANDGMGVAGAAPSAIIFPVKIGNRLGGSITDARIAAGIQFAATNGARVINMSFGGGTVGVVVTNAIRLAQIQTAGGIKGAVCVGAMGNSGDNTIFFPAAISGVVSVGALGSTGQVAAFSTFGEWITVAAPGGDGGGSWGGLTNNSGQIFSTYPNYIPSIGPPIVPKSSITNLSYMSGTSMATPHVSAAAALLLQKKPYLSQAQVWAHLALFSTHDRDLVSVTNPINGTVTKTPDSAFSTVRGYGYMNVNMLLQAQQPTVGRTTGIPHVFPLYPRDHYVLGDTNNTPSGLQNVDMIKGNFTNTFRVIVVDDRGERIPNAQVTAHFTLLDYSSAPLGYPTTNVIDTPLLDNGVAAQDDLLPQDCVYGNTIFFPGSLSNCIFQVRYLATAPGMRPNTNKVVKILVQ